MSVRISYEDAVAVVTLDRVEALNALNEELISQIGDAIDEVARSRARAVVFVGEGRKAFCAGADIKEIQRRSPEEMRRAVAFGQGTFAKLDTLAIPSIAVLQGFTLGGGLELALACTFRVAFGDIKIGLPEIKLGLIPGYGGTQRLPRIVGPARALEIILSGRMIHTEEAERIGLVNAIEQGADSREVGVRYAQQFTEFSAGAILNARKAVAAASETSLAAGLEIEAELLVEAFGAEDGREGMSAFVEKRAARFNRS
ncbi:short chain enoyl-CoA hydratase [Azorhizobium sp. AG788]|uniref:enoyl-CoA hydratase/isomerase family protein n=1 Tax=Azorhizobium sp. AG788 TaxID=2183897 RepID=UPI00105E7185|nr:enoyl-CoA hydratase-related protein [Azorhizobium sp. AG788]TDU00868.1 short chain enoyl-CoA hydratase [Azorhizobium sp. AG788]